MAHQTGLSAKALRLYHDNGLLVPAGVSAHNGYRQYDASQVTLGRTIRRLRNLGMPLGMIADVVAADPLRARELVVTWVVGLERDLDQVRKNALANLDVTGDSAFVPHVREVDPAILACVRVSVTPESIGTVIAETAKKIATALRSAGATPEPEVWAIYHDPVSAGVQVPIEICVPYTGTAIPADDVILRAESGGTEVFTPVRGDDVNYPGILPAFTAVMAHAHTLSQNTGAPREIYTAGFPDEPQEFAAQVAVRLVP